jgi:hypothetical protein
MGHDETHRSSPPLALVAHSAASWVFLPALVGVAGCGSDASSLGTDEAAVEVSVCLAGEITRKIVVSTQAKVAAPARPGGCCGRSEGKAFRWTGVRCGAAFLHADAVSP